jgi:gamma-glutamyltranspeptidase / glutathione hydrolase
MGNSSTVNENGTKGAVAAGHAVTMEAGCEVLAAGGNAYDAAIAAFFTSCVAEPVLSSLGGGGFLLSQTAAGQHQLFDFFVQTPCCKQSFETIDFKPIWADFGATRQEFHIGLGAIATPGAVKGMFEVHREFGSIPMTELVQPAIAAARTGIRLNALQAYIFRIVSPILSASDEVASAFSGNDSGNLIGEGELFRMPELADTLEMLAAEGDALFYQGEMGQLIATQCSDGGGHLRRNDLESYQVIRQHPLQINYRDSQIVTNPPPSSGGILIAFALRLWQQVCDSSVAPDSIKYGSLAHLQLLTQVMAMSNQARIEAHIDDTIGHPSVDVLLDEKLLDRYRDSIIGRSKAHRGTTHISVIDRWKNVATLTVSNGEGCGRMVPGTGIMLNNMLGEEDLNPHGFQQWQENQRMTSMMAPSVINQIGGGIVALGSGGSNRIRSAILQTIINLTDFDKSLHDAVCLPRVHFENDLLNVEKGFSNEVLSSMFEQYSQHKCWDALNLFFGGVHSVQYRDGLFGGVGDPRRGGVCRVL